MPVILKFTGSIVLRNHRQPEAVALLMPLEALVALLLHVLLIVDLVDLEWSLAELAILESLLQINQRTTNNVVALEEVSIEGLNCEPVIFPRHLNLIVETVVE